jgi:hypothetical protein
MAKLHAGEVDAMALVDRIERAFAADPHLVINASGDFSGPEFNTDGRLTSKANRYAAMVAVHTLIVATDEAGLTEDVPG